MEFVIGVIAFVLGAGLMWWLRGLQVQQMEYEILDLRRERMIAELKMQNHGRSDGGEA